MQLTPRLAGVLNATHLEDLTAEHLDALVAARISEDQDLDFKAGPTPYKVGPAGNFSLAKDVAALANQVGGMLLLGVSQDDQARATELSPMEISDENRTRFEQALSERITPMVSGVRIHAIQPAPGDELGYYAIYVPRSVQAPHALRHRELTSPFMCYPIRNGTTTRHLYESELANRYRDRFALALGDFNRLEEVRRQGQRREDLKRLHLGVGLVPSIRGNRPILGPGPTIKDFPRTWLTSMNKIADTLSGYAGVARRRIKLQSGSSGRVELHSDGSAWAHTCIGERNQIMGGTKIAFNLDQFEETLVELLALVGGYATWSGAAGDGSVIAEIFGAGGSPVVWTRPHMPERAGSVESLPDRPADGVFTLEQLAGTRQEVGVAAYQLVCDLEHDMDIPEPVVLRADGSIERAPR